jgi:hypothetical protein
MTATALLLSMALIVASLGAFLAFVIHTHEELTHRDLERTCHPVQQGLRLISEWWLRHEELPQPIGRKLGRLRW